MAYESLNRQVLVATLAKLDKATERFTYVNNLLKNYNYSEDDAEYIKNEFGKYGIDYADFNDETNQFTRKDGDYLVFGEYYDYIDQFRESDPELYELLLSNPYLYSDDIGKLNSDGHSVLGGRSDRDTLLAERVQQAVEWADEQSTTYRTNKENSPVNQVQKNNLAGINSDLQGTDNVETVEKPDLGHIPNVDFVGAQANETNRRLGITNSILSGIGTIANLASSLNSIRLNNAQIYKLQSETLSTNTDHVFDWFLRNLDYKPVEQIAKALRDQKRVELGRELNETELKQVEFDAYQSHIESSLSSSDWLPARLQGYSKFTQDSVKNILSTLNPNSTYVKGKIAAYQKQLMSDNVDIAQQFAHPYYNEDTLAMAAFYKPVSNLNKDLFENGVKYQNAVMQHELNYVTALEDMNIKLKNGEITEEEYQSLSLSQKRAYLQVMQVEQLKADVNARQLQNKYIAEMMKNVNDLEGKEGFERFWSQAQSWISQFLLQTSMSGMNIGVGLNGGVNLGFNRSQSQSTVNSNSTSTSTSMSTNHNYNHPVK